MSWWLLGLFYVKFYNHQPGYLIFKWIKEHEKNLFVWSSDFRPQKRENNFRVSEFQSWSCENANLKCYRIFFKFCLHTIFDNPSLDTPTPSTPVTYFRKSLKYFSSKSNSIIRHSRDPSLFTGNGSVMEYWKSFINKL